MSTILKALQRLEHERENPGAPIPGEDFLAAPGEPVVRDRARRAGLFVALPLLVALLVAGFVWRMMPAEPSPAVGSGVQASTPLVAPEAAPGTPSPQVLARAPSAPPVAVSPPAVAAGAPAAAAGSPAHVGVPAEVVASSPPPLGLAPSRAIRPTPAGSSTPGSAALAAAPGPAPQLAPAPAPSQAMPESGSAPSAPAPMVATEPPTPRTRPAAAPPTVAERPAPAPAVREARKPSAPAQQVASATPRPPPPAPRPAAAKKPPVPRKPAARAPRVAALPPSVVVHKTIWHPTPERRVARVEIQGISSVVELREGDAIGTLVVSKIEPAGVVFLHGGQTLRRKVATPGRTRR